jgi:hypothetical protein
VRVARSFVKHITKVYGTESQNEVASCDFSSYLEAGKMPFYISASGTALDPAVQRPPGK